MKVLDVNLFQEGLQRNISMLDRLRSEIEVIHRAVEGLVQLEGQLKGEGGDAIRSFYEECHLPFLQYFQLFSEHFKQVLRQMETALYSLEPDSAGYIVEQFLEGELEQGLTLIGQLTANLTDETNSIMDQVRDIVGLPHLDDSGVQEGVIHSKRKRDDTVERLHEFDATQTTALSPIEQGIQTMETWLSDLEGLYKDGLTDIHFQTNLWASLSSNNFLKTDLSQRTTPLADLSTMTDRKNHLKTMLQLFLAGARPIRFGYGGLIKPSTLLGHNILAFSSMTAPIKLSNKESMSEDKQLEMIYAELSKQPHLSNHHSDTPIDPNTGEYMVTFEGKRKVMGGNGSGTPDGLAPFTMATYDFFLGDIATIVGPEATVNERIEAAAFTFVKPLKVADTGHDLLKAGENAKDAGKGIDKTRPSWRQSEIDVEKDFPEYNAQKSFKDGKEVPYGEKGSSRPDLYQTGHSIEVKNYKITTSSGRSRLVNNVSKQVEKRLSDLPNDTKQSVIIDIRGQNVSDEILDELYEKIMNKTNGKVDIRFKTN